MSTRARISVSRSVVVASGRIHSSLCITPTASREASPCRAGKIFVAARNTRRKNPPPSIARSLGLALSGSITASKAPTAVPNLPRHRASWSLGGTRHGASFMASSASSESDSESDTAPSIEFLRSSTHAANPAGSSARARARRSRRTLRMPPVAALSRVRTSRSTSSKSARRIPSHVGWLTSESIGASSPSSSTLPAPAVSSSSSSSSSPAPPRVLKRSSSRGSLEDAATERLCTRSDASSRDSSSHLEGSCEGAPSVEDADPARMRSWRRQASASALRCCSMTLQCLSRRCERCTSWGRVSRAKARSDAVSHRAGSRCRAPPPTPSRSPPPPSSAGTASRSSISADLAAASSSSVSSSPQSSSSSISASPVNRAVSSSAPDGAVAAAPSAPPSQSSREADRPGSDAEVSAARSGSDDRATGNLKGLSNRLATQQYPSHAPMGAAR
mmetsp:Transcript_3458/g.13796  ORF Transcript_3458/g.13796 Transcript_3458/m.13796 type:complete len:446 (+) Transcript_3458:4058-5395(+)